VSFVELLLIPWKADKPFMWDVTAICSMTASYVDSSVCKSAAAAVEIATGHKMAKYSNL